jgi:hypothetical protein
MRTGPDGQDRLHELIATCHEDLVEAIDAPGNVT